MTQELLNLDPKKLLFVDIETASEFPTITSDHPKYDAWAWKNRNRETDSLKTEEENIRDYEQKAALYPCFNKIVCITAGFIQDDKIYLKTFRGEEAEILQGFVTMQNEKGKTLVLWNAPFDVPIIRKRFMINRLQNYLSNPNGNDSMKKPWTLAGVLDLMDVWKGISFAAESMDEVALALGLPSPKVDMKGSEVSKAYHNGEIEKIISYCQSDVTALINIFQIFTYREPITEVIVKKDLEKLPIIQQIFNSGQINAEQEAKLITFISTLNKAETKELSKILEAAVFPNQVPITLKIHF